jgi:hypothetical protein
VVAMRDTARCAESVVAAVVRGRYEESEVAMVVTTCYTNSLVASKASGRYGDVTAIVESQR